MKEIKAIILYVLALGVLSAQLILFPSFLLAFLTITYGALLVYSASWDEKKGEHEVLVKEHCCNRRT